MGTNAALPAAMAVLDAINSGDFSALPDAVTADFVDHGSPFPLPPGPEGYANTLGFVHHQLKVRYTLDEVIDPSDAVMGVNSVGGAGSGWPTWRRASTSKRARSRPASDPRPRTRDRKRRG